MKFAKQLELKMDLFSFLFHFALIILNVEVVVEDVQKIEKRLMSPDQEKG